MMRIAAAALFAEEKPASLSLATSCFISLVLEPSLRTTATFTPTLLDVAAAAFRWLMR